MTASVSIIITVTNRSKIVDMLHLLYMALLHSLTQALAYCSTVLQQGVSHLALLSSMWWGTYTQFQEHIVL